MRNRTNELYKKVCVPKAKPYFFVVDQEKGETIEEKVLRESFEPQDILILFVT